MAIYPMAPLLAAVVDLAFFPLLILTVLPSLIKARTLHNYPFPVVLAALFIGNLLVHLEILELANTARTGLLLTIDVLLLLITIVGGRIIPSFTWNYVRRHRLPIIIPKLVWLERACTAVTLAVLVTDMVLPDSWTAGLVALIAALLHGLRLANWRGYGTLREPLLWVLHLGYLWVPLGLLLKALWLLADVELAANWLHAITVGAFATLILAVMTRTSLGHTGRDLTAAPPIVLAYFLLTLAAVLRVFGAVLDNSAYHLAIVGAGMCWIATFVIFCVVYAPILWSPRVDGRPG